MSSEQPEGIAAYVRRLRLRAGLTQEALAERTGVTVDTVGALERGLRRQLYPQTASALADALGLEDAERAALTELASGRAQAAPAPVSAAAPAGPRVEPSPVTLPTPLTSFVGRREAVAEVAAFLGTVRLLTLKGPGGVGKTRLPSRPPAPPRPASATASGSWISPHSPTRPSLRRL